MFKMLRNNKGETGAEVHEEVDHDVMIAQLDEDEKAKAEDREPEDLIGKSKKKPEESDETPEDKPEADIEEKPEDEQTEESEDKPEEESEEDAETEESDDKEEKSDEEVDRDKQITEHAEESGMTYADAKEDLEKTDKIVEQFGGDSKKMAIAMRNKDREYDKLKNEKTQAVNKTPAFQKLSEGQFRDACGEKFEEDKAREGAIEGYKRRFPAKSEAMTDEAIIEDVVDREWRGYQVYATQEESNLTDSAKKIKDDFILSIEEADKKYIPEIKVMLDRIKPHQVHGQNWNPQVLIDIAKGQRADVEIKAAEERGYKRGLEKAEILGLKKKVGGQKPGSKPVKPTVSLNKDQKSRASDMFPEFDGYSQEQAEKMFIETYEEELKKDKNYI